jgi:hypothetical protein
MRPPMRPHGTGYGPPAEPDQWRAAAEWIHCASIHGADGLDLDAIAGEVELPWGKVYSVVARVTDALKDVADTIAAGATKEACCREEQRRNHAVNVEMRAAKQPDTTTGKE